MLDCFAIVVIVVNSVVVLRFFAVGIGGLYYAYWFGSLIARLAVRVCV